MSTLSGAQIIVESLKKEGVDIVFGIPGGANLPTFDELCRSSIKVILPAHEQSASHMADGYARASGKVGVCLATSGPGATNLVTGLGTAMMDSIPMVAITGQVKTFMIGNDAFQEADTMGITRPVTKHSYMLKDVKDVARVIKEAFHIARTGRPGPVLIDVPVDVSTAKTEFAYPGSVDIRGYRLSERDLDGDPAQIRKAAEAIAQAKRPLLYAGGGVIASGASAELIELVRKTRIPVTTTLLGLGAFPETDPLSIGMLGMHGFEYTNIAVAECDLLIAVGARFDDRVTGKVDEFATKSKKIHIDVDASSIDKVIPVDIPIVGDVKHVLKQLNSMVKMPETAEWRRYLGRMRSERPLVYKERGKILPQFVIQQISEATQGDAVVATGVGQHQMWVAQFYHFNKPRSMITSGGLGTMGFGLPAAIGAQFARPHDVVWDVDGDGSFMMLPQELAIAARHKLPLKVALLNNHYHGMVRQWQDLFYEGRHAASETNQADFVKMAEAFGCHAVRVDKVGHVRSAIDEAMSVKDRPAFIEFVTERVENLWPMVAPGKRSDEMLGTHKELMEEGAVAIHRRIDPAEESELSLS